MIISEDVAVGSLHSYSLNFELVVRRIYEQRANLISFIGRMSRGKTRCFFFPQGRTKGNTES